MPIITDFLHFKGISLLVLYVELCSIQGLYSGLLKFSKVNLKETFVTLYGIKNLTICQRNCLDRPKCRALNYHTQYPFECSLNSEAVVDLQEMFGWIHQAKPDLQLKTRCINCNYNQTCDRRTRRCIYKECEPIKSNTDYIRLGNGNTVGSKAVLACPYNTYPESYEQNLTWPITGVCQDDGQWSFPWIPKCVEFGEHFCNSYQIEPANSTDHRWSNFAKKTIKLVSGLCGVSDSMISSSSNFNHNFVAFMVKFDHQRSTGDMWVSKEEDENAFIQVNFTRKTEVNGIEIRGRKTDKSEEYPTLFNVTYSSYCSQDIPESFARNKTGGANFAGNSDGNSTVEHMFEHPIIALCVIVNILNYTNTRNFSYFGMQMELFGTVKLPVL